MPRGKIQRYSNRSLRFFLVISAIATIATFSFGFLLLRYSGNSQGTEFSGNAPDRSDGSFDSSHLSEVEHATTSSTEPTQEVFDTPISPGSEPMQLAFEPNSGTIGIVPSYPLSSLTMQLPSLPGGISGTGTVLPSPVSPQDPGESLGLPPVMGSGGYFSPKSAFGTPPQVAGGSPTPPSNYGGNPAPITSPGNPPHPSGGSPPTPSTHGSNPPVSTSLGNLPQTSGGSLAPSTYGGNSPLSSALTTSPRSPEGSGNTLTGPGLTGTLGPGQASLSSTGDGTETTPSEGENFWELTKLPSEQPAPPTAPIPGETILAPAITGDALPAVIIPELGSYQVTSLTDGGNSTPPAPVPEPDTLLLFCSALGSYFIYRMKSRKAR